VRRQKQADVTGPRPDSAGESAVTADLPLVTPPPVLSPAAAAVVSVAAGVTFALLTAWVARQGPAMPAVDEHVHRWVISRRSRVASNSLVLSRGVVSPRLPCPRCSSSAQWPSRADVISGGASGQGSCSCASRAPGSMRSSGSTRWSDGRGLPWRTGPGQRADRRSPPATPPTPRCSRRCVPGSSLPRSRPAGLVVRSGPEPSFMPPRWAGLGYGWGCTGPLMSSVAGSTA
jgi:hypothetical protein